MTRKYWLGLSPSLLMAAGLIVSTFTAARAAEFEWLVMAGPLLLAFALVGADVLDSRLRGESSGPSWAALLLGGSILLAGLIVTLRDPRLVKTFIPVMGGAASVSLVLRPEGRRKACVRI